MLTSVYEMKKQKPVEEELKRSVFTEYEDDLKKEMEHWKMSNTNKRKMKQFDKEGQL